MCAVGLLLMLRIGPEADYVVDVLAGASVFGFGMAIMVAPLTATALAAAPDEHAGLASGVTNAVARVAGLLAIAVLPAVVGIGDEPLAFFPAQALSHCAVGGPPLRVATRPRGSDRPQA